METPPASPYGSLAQNARSQELKKAKGILWVVGILTILANLFLFMNAESALDKEIEKDLGKNGITLAQVKNLPDEVRATFEAERSATLGKVRLVYGASIAMGVLFIVCALAVNRMPVAATVTGLVLYLGGTAAFAALDSENLKRGLIFKVLIIVGLISSVKTALTIEKQARDLRAA